MSLNPDLEGLISHNDQQHDKNDLSFFHNEPQR
jgi:hypothetical protein